MPGPWAEGPLSRPAGAYLHYTTVFPGGTTSFPPKTGPVFTESPPPIDSRAVPRYNS